VVAPEAPPLAPIGTVSVDLLHPKLWDYFRSGDMQQVAKAFIFNHLRLASDVRNFFGRCLRALCADIRQEDN
jgi:hypothetical protein